MWNRYSRPAVLGDTVDTLTAALRLWPHHIYAETHRAWAIAARTGPWSVTAYTRCPMRDGRSGCTVVARHRGIPVVTIPDPSPALIVEQLLAYRVPIPAAAVRR